MSQTLAEPGTEASATDTWSQGPHPILACARRLSESLDAVAETGAVFMEPTDKAAALVELQRDLDRVAELQLRVLATADDVAATNGSRDPGAWLAQQAHLDRSAGRAAQRLATGIDGRWAATGAALREGRLTREHAQVIVRAMDALDSLPKELADRVDARVRTQAEEQLIADASRFTPAVLAKLGERILDVIAPEVGEEQLRRALERDEARARRRTWLTTRRRGGGSTMINACVPDPIAARLKSYLHAFTNPRRPANDGHDHDAPAPNAPASQRLPYPEKMGRAFCALLEQLDPDQLPTHGGRATSVVITIDLEALRSGLGVATTDSGGHISVGEARRLACTADLIPAVLGGDSEILDLGRARRCYSPAQRIAMGIRDKTCRAEGCDVPAAWCEAHHLRPWSRGGRTDVDDGALFCSHHHHRIHDPAYLHARLPDGTFRFHRRT